MKSKYMILKKYGAHGLEWYYVCKRRPMSWLFGWSIVTREHTQVEAEKYIENKKRVEENLSRKPEVIGYY